MRLLPSARSPVRRNSLLLPSRSGLQMRVPPFIEILVRISHRLRAAASEHDLEINGFEAVIHIAMNDAGRTGNAFPLSQPPRDAPALLVLEKHGEIALQDEKDLFD